MKNLLIAVLGVFSVAANATSPMRRTVVLSYDESLANPKLVLQAPKIKLTKLQVFMNGDVYRGDCPAHQRFCHMKKVHNIERMEMEGIWEDLNEAKDKQSKLIRGPIAMCFAPAMKEHFIAADSYQMPLEKGDICSMLYVSDTAAGQNLTQKVKELVRITAPKRAH